MLTMKKETLAFHNFYAWFSSVSPVSIGIHLIHKWPPTWDERAAKHGIEAFMDKKLFSYKLWPTYVEIIGHLKAIFF